MNKWVKRGLITAVILAIGGGLVVAGQRSKAKADAAPKYRTALVDRGAITQVVLSSGTVQPVKSVNVGTQVSGTVLERYVDFNDRVKKGQIMLRLDPALIEARIRQATAQVSSATAGLAVARSTHERNVKLLAQGFISGSIVDQSKQQLDAALAQLEVAKAQLDQAQTDLNNSVIRSPIDGIVTRRAIDVGQTVAASFQTPDLFTVANDLKKMQIFSNVSEADVGLVREGQAVRFFVDAYPEREFEGKVSQFRLNPANQAGVVTYVIVIDLDNPEELLKPGMTAQTRIVVASKKDVVRIPTAALRFRPPEDSVAKKEEKKDDKKDATAEDGKGEKKAPATKTAPAADPNDDGALSTLKAGQRVFRVYTVGEDNKPKAHEVTIGISNTRFTEMASGSIKPGDALITRSLKDATPGSED
jgi:HlyD family secretion protein